MSAHLEEGARIVQTELRLGQRQHNSRLQTGRADLSHRNTGYTAIGYLLGLAVIGAAKGAAPSQRLGIGSYSRL